MASQATGFNLIMLMSLLLLLSFILVASQSNCSINLNSSLTAGSNGSPWLSPSGEFSFGFQPLKNNQDHFLLSIWFERVREVTIVWSINDDHTVSRGSRVHLTNTGDFVLYNPQDQEIWKAWTRSQRATCGAMLDSGNFVLINGDSNSNSTAYNVWESFDTPTDTILPGQRLPTGGNLTSRQSESDFSKGRFQLRMQYDGNLVLYTIFLPTETRGGPYWSTGTSPTNYSTQLVFDEARVIYLERRAQNIFNVTSVSSRDLGTREDYYHFARLDFDGVFRYYRHPRQNPEGAWSQLQAIPDDICRSKELPDLSSGVCGHNSYCVKVNGRRHNCICPDGYSPLDPLALHRGCRPNFELPSCQKNGWELNGESVDLKELNNTDFPMPGYERQNGVDKERCKVLCLEDCFCVAAVYNDNRCWKKRFPLMNGRQSRDLNTITLIKVPRNNVTTGTTSPPPKGKNWSTLFLILWIFLGSSLFLNLLLLIATSVVFFIMYNKKMATLQTVDATYGVRRFTYKELHEATDGFRQQLGRGSFGTVYKGVIASLPKKDVAIKKLDKVVKDGEKEFITEVRAIGRTHHKNLVTLLGYCDEGTHRLLVYEYMSNGSLSGLVFGGDSRPRWIQRTQIALGIARGLTYLHEECSTQIIHCDVKPQNILLDESLTPKISDFGLAKLLLSEQSRAAKTHIRGTVGYFAPEWFRKASITVKVDVYSFGVLLLEMICGTSCVKFAFGGGDEEVAFVDWVYDCYCKGEMNRLVEGDEEARNDMEGVERLVMVASWCIQEDASSRPSMRTVTQMLEGVTPVPVPPCPSAFSST